MFPEFEKYSLYPKSKGTITSVNTIVMKEQTFCNQFEPTTNTSSATICKWCGQEKFLHDPKVGNMVQKTAVEWLIEQLKEYDFSTEDDRYIIKIPSWLLTEKEEQAKQMEKDQIIDAFWNGDNSDCTSEQNAKEFAEEYYNQTYNQDSELPKEDKTFKRKSQWTEVDNMTKRLK